MEWSFRNDLPIYSQLVERIKLGIVTGELPPGARLPSVRELAAEAGVNPNTMQRALTELERYGLVFTQRTAGRFVTEDVAVIDGCKTAMAESRLADFIAAMEKLGYDRAGIAALLTGTKEENQYADTGM
ncbi:MAG: GntR family transcriptional regulator [Oscillospiraceae bacterium]|nr:GntR family transcriptional regulator [Oscillospiraceae bacterium]